MAIPAVAGLFALLFWSGGSSSADAALPESAQALYHDTKMTAPDGRALEFPGKTVTCSLESTVSAEEGPTNCPALYNLDSVLAPPQVSARNIAVKCAGVCRDRRGHVGRRSLPQLLGNLPDTVWRDSLVGERISGSGIHEGRNRTHREHCMAGLLTGRTPQLFLLQSPNQLLRRHGNGVAGTRHSIAPRHTQGGSSGAPAGAVLLVMAGYRPAAEWLCRETGLGRIPVDDE